MASTQALPVPLPLTASSSSSSSSSFSSSFPSEVRASTIIACPFIYGSCATVLPKKSQDIGTHKWTLFLRGPNGEDLSVFISKVVFTLHPSFAISVREVTSHPFEVHEAGWGEFDANIMVHFHEPSERPISLTHCVKLYPHDIPEHMTNAQAMKAYKGPVMSEVYDEIVFVDPSSSFKQCLMSYKKPDKPVVHELSGQFTAFDDEEDIYRLTVIRDHIQREIESAKGKLIMLDADMSCLQTTRARVPRVSSRPPQSDAPKAAPTKEDTAATKKKKATKSADDSKPPKKKKKDKESGAGEGAGTIGKTPSTAYNLSSSSVPAALPPTPITSDLPLASSSATIKAEPGVRAPSPLVPSVAQQGPKPQFTSLAQVYNVKSPEKGDVGAGAFAKKVDILKDMILCETQGPVILSSAYCKHGDLNFDKM